MPQQVTQKATNTFIKGLITELGELTFPPDASVDELNCYLARDGARSTRLGFNLEPDFVNADLDVGDDTLVNLGEWTNVANVGNLNFVVVQVGGTLHFYNKQIRPFSTGRLIGQTVNIHSYQAAGAVDSRAQRCQFASLNGRLVVVNAGLDPFSVSYNIETGAVATSRIPISIRDFEWQGSKTYYYGNDLSPSDDRRYDTYNAGWKDEQIYAFRTAFGSTAIFPKLTHPWYAGKDADGNFDVGEWYKIYVGNSLTANGHYILDYFYKNRTGASEVSGATNEQIYDRFTSVCSYGGRVWYAGAKSGEVLFSQQAFSLGDFGDCYQRNDPTAENFSDLLDTDGGLINIREAQNIKKLHVYGTMLFIFADNGVWGVQGTDGVFRATDYSVTKVSNNGLLDTNTFTSAEGVPLWWSNSGIHSLEFDQVTSIPKESSLSATTIQTYWNNISLDAKRACYAVYDEANRRVIWGYKSNGSAEDNRRDMLLIFDLTLGAFYPWQVSGTTQYILGGFYYSGFNSSVVSDDVVTTAGDTVVDAGAATVTVIRPEELASSESSIIYFVRNGDNVTMGAFYDTTYLDFDTEEYECYAEAGHEFVGDMSLKKTSPFILTYMRDTSTTVTDGESDVPSSLLVKAIWDFRDNTAVQAQQAYRPKPLVVGDGTWPVRESVNVTRLKLRGSGRNLRVRFDGEPGMKFDLLGYSMIYGVNRFF